MSLVIERVVRVSFAWITCAGRFGYGSAGTSYWSGDGESGGFFVALREQPIVHDGESAPKRSGSRTGRRVRRFEKAVQARCGSIAVEDRFLLDFRGVDAVCECVTKGVPLISWANVHCCKIADEE